MAFLKKLSKGFDAFLNYFFYIPAFMMFALLVICAVQVLFRKILIGAFNWADEAMRFLMVYSTFIALPALVAGKKNITIDLTDLLFPHSEKNRFRIHVIAEILTFLACALLIPSCGTFMANNMKAASTALHIPMWLVYSCLPIGFGLSALASLNNLFKMLTQPKEG